MRRCHVAVLMGGRSAEREVSLVSGEACATALEERGHHVTRVDAGIDLPEVLLRLRPERVFNALHGRLGEDGRVQGLLDLLGIPYTHSGVLASALAMDKPMAKRVFASAGLRCPDGVETSLADLLAAPPLDPPFVVKPAAEGSSVGVVIVPDRSLRPLTDRNDIDPATRLLVESYVPGRELTCAVLGEEALAVTEIRPNVGFYDYRAKYTEGFASHLVPAPLSPDLYEQVLETALAAHRALACRGVSRADFRLDPTQGEDGLYLLEVNTQPGMTPLSLVPEQAAWRGIPFPDLVERLLEWARCDM
ncbi:MAG: D-alanine--D-alanine ligase [Geminicoccaceae bacterium]